MNLKVLREIKNQKFRSLLIIAIVAVILGMLVGMRAGYPMMDATYELNMVENHVADGRYTFMNPILENNVSIIEEDEDFISENNIDRIEGRIIYQSEINYTNEIFPAVIIGIDFPNQINQVYLEQVSEDVNAETNFLEDKNNCIIETRFAGNLLGQDMSLNENISVDLYNQNIDFTVKAIGQDTDYLYVVDPATQMTLLGKMAIVWVDKDILQDQLFGGLPFINQILFTVDDRLNQDMIKNTASALISKFHEDNIDTTIVQFEIYDETVDRQFYDADAGSVDKMGTIFGIIGLIVCAVAIYNTLSRLVQAQRRNIGLFMSMGAKPKIIIVHYLKITLFLAVIGLIVGIPLGYGMSIGMTKLVVRLYSLHYFTYPIVWQEYLISGAATLFVCMVFSIISAFPVTKITPRKAMSGFFNRIKVSKDKLSEKLFKWLPGFQSLHMLVPIREITLRKKKSMVTILAITTSMIILITSVAMVTNMYSAVIDNYDKYNTADIQIKLSSPISQTELNSFMENFSQDEILHYEKFVYTYVKIYDDDKLLTLTELNVYQTNSTLRNFHIVSGNVHDKSEITKNQIVLGKSLAGKYDLGIDSEITLGSLQNYTVKIGALVGELVDYSAFWTFDAFYTDNLSTSFGFSPGEINGIMLDLNNDADRSAIEIAFKENLPVSTWMDSQEAKESVLTLMETMMSVLVLFILVGMFIGILFSFNTMYMGFISRENDFLAFKAMGTEPKYMRKMIFWENVLLSVFSLIITIPVGYLFYWWSMDYMLEDRFYVPLSIPIYTWPIVFLLSMVSIWLATRRVSKKIDKMVLIDELRQRVIT